MRALTEETSRAVVSISPNGNLVVQDVARGICLGVQLHLGGPKWSVLLGLIIPGVGFALTNLPELGVN